MLSKIKRYLQKQYSSLREQASLREIRATGEARTKKAPRYRSLRLQKRIRPNKYKPLPSAWKLWRGSIKTFWKFKRPILGFILVYGILYFLFVKGLSNGIDLGKLKAYAESASQGSWGKFYSGVSLLSILLTTANATSGESAALYQLILTIIGSLAFVWLLRHLVENEGKRVRIRDAFYLGMQPLVPFCIVLVVLVLELIPLTAGNFMLNTVFGGGLASGVLEKSIFVLIYLLMALLTLYLISGAIAALYIVTLPGAQPIRSIRLSYKILAIHRWSVVRKLLLLFIFIIVAAALIFVPILFLVPASVSWITQYVFFACSISTFAIVHIYLFTLYRSLL